MSEPALPAQRGGRFRGPWARLGAGAVVFGIALATRTYYYDDLLSDARRERPDADFRTAITPVTQKYTLVYEARAKGILRGEGLLYTRESPDRLLSIQHPPGYPLFIAAVYRVAPAKIRSVTRAQMLLDAGCAALVCLLIGGTFNPAAGVLAGLLIGLSPHLAFNSLVPMPDTASAWPIVVGLLAVARLGQRHEVPAFAFAGFCIGVSCWLRANAMLLPLAVAVVAWRVARRPAAPIAVLTGALLTIAPITLRNAVQYGVFVPVGWGTGGTLVQGIADYDFENRFGYPKFDRDLGQWDDATIRTHLDRERLLLRKGFQVVKDHPLWFAGVVVRRALFQWSYDTGSREAPETPFHTRFQAPVLEGRGLRSAIRAAQSGWSTAAGRLLSALGVLWLAAARRRRELALLTIVPAYYLFFQSLLHTEYRYCLVIHYFLFSLMAVGVVETARRLGPAARELAGRLARRRERQAS